MSLFEVPILKHIPWASFK